MNPTIPTIDAGDPWWLVVLKILAPIISLAITIGLPLLLRKGFQALDRWQGWNTEERGMRVAQRLVLAGEQMVRKVIAQDLADETITKAEAQFRLAKLASDTVDAVVAELGVSPEVAKTFVEAAVLATGVSKGTKSSVITATDP